MDLVNAAIYEPRSSGSAPDRLEILKFFVDGVTETGEVVGRNDASDIPVGTVFTSISKHRVDGDPMHLQTIDLGEMATVSLRLTSVEWYQRQINFVPGGHTARLSLAGDDIATLISLHSAKADRECLSLVAETD